MFKNVMITFPHGLILSMAFGVAILQNPNEQHLVL